MDTFLYIYSIYLYSLKVLEISPTQLSSSDIKWFILMKYPVNLTWKEFSFEDTRPTEFRNNFKWLLKSLSFIINPVSARLPGGGKKSLSISALSIWALVWPTECCCWGLSSLLVPWCTLCYNFGVSRRKILGDLTKYNRERIFLCVFIFVMGYGIDPLQQNTLSISR